MKATWRCRASRGGCGRNLDHEQRLPVRAARDPGFLRCDIAVWRDRSFATFALPLVQAKN
jgi:hypothetical protein